MSRIVIIIILLLFVLGVIRFYIQDKAPEITWNAARSLKKNHQLIARDLEKSLAVGVAPDLTLPTEFIGKYLTDEKTKGSVVELKDVTDIPQIGRIEDGFVSVIYSLPEKQIDNLDLIDVGSKINICATKTQSAAPTALTTTTVVICLSEAVEVLATHRKVSEGSGNWLMLKVKSDKQIELTEVMTLDKQVLLIVKNG